MRALPDDLRARFVAVYEGDEPARPAIRAFFAQAQAAHGDAGAPAPNLWLLAREAFRTPLETQRDLLFFARRRLWSGVSALPKGVAFKLAALCKKSYTLFSIEDLFIANGCEPSWRIPPFKPHDSERMNEAQGWLDGILVYAPEREVAIVQSVCEAMLENPRLAEASRQTLHEIVAQLAAPAPPNPLDVYNLHPTVRRLAGPLVANQHLDEAVLKVYIALNEEVKRITGQPALDGTDLMRRAFSPNNPLLQLATDRAEQQGWMELFAGAIMAIRNPRAHHLNLAPDLDETIGWLVFALTLFRALERATRTISTTP